MQRLTGIVPTKVRTIWGLLSTTPDPEVPVLVIIDLGTVRNAMRRGDGWTTGFTLTYSGCPAMEHLLDETCVIINEYGLLPVYIVLQLDLPWAAGWMSQEVHERLRQYGTNPPQGHACHADMPAGVNCSRYGSAHVPLISKFGSMACKALYRYDNCCKPFDYFKCT